jgi:hypothetical protein
MQSGICRNHSISTELNFKNRPVEEDQKPKMIGEGNESTEDGPGKKGEKSSRDEEASQEKEDHISPSSKEKGNKGDSKSHISEPADADQSDKNDIEGSDVPLSFPQRVS